jgi:hypothetical protein
MQARQELMSELRVRPLQYGRIQSLHPLDLDRSPGQCSFTFNHAAGLNLALAFAVLPRSIALPHSVTSSAFCYAPVAANPLAR